MTAAVAKVEGSGQDGAGSDGGGDVGQVRDGNAVIGQILDVVSRNRAVPVIGRGNIMR